MGKTKRSKKPKEESQTSKSPGSPASVGPGKLPVIVALTGLAVLAFVLLTTEAPERHSAPIPTVSDLERWQSAPEVNLDLAPDRVIATGPEDAPVTIVEFSDFECPYCRDANGVLKSILDQFPGDIRLVFKNYPLDTACNEYVQQSAHLYACRAAAIAYCASKQDRFWEMHDAIFALDSFNLTALNDLSGEVGLSEDAFQACLGDEATMRAIRADIDEGKGLGVSGTPAIFVNGKRAASFRSSTLVPIVEHLLSEGS